MTQALLALADQARHAGGEAVGLGAFDQNSAGMAISGLGDFASFLCFATGMFRGDQPQKGHELLRTLKAGQVAKFGDDGRRHDHRNTAKGLQGGDHGSHTPVGHQRCNLLGQSFRAISRFFDGVNVLLKDGLLRGSWHLLIRQPAEMSLRPVVFRILETQAKEHAAQLLLRYTLSFFGILAAAGQISHCFVLRAGNKDVGQFTGTVEASQDHGITAIGLDPVRRTLGNMGG